MGDERRSDPDILLRCPLATHIPRIEHAARLDQEQLDLVLGVRFVIHPLRNDEHLSRPDEHRAVAKIDPQITFNDDERLVSVFVTMPDEVRRLRIFGQRDRLKADRSKKGREKWA